MSSFDKIVVGFDGSDESHDALALAEHLAGPGSELQVAVVQWDDNLAAETRRFDCLFGEAKHALGDQAFVKRPLRGVDAAEELHKFAEENDSDLIVLGSCHRGKVGRVVFGSTGERLLHGAPCAVAIAPRGYATDDHARRGILGVAYTGSPESKLALAAATDLASELDSSIRLISVIPRSSTPGRVTGTDRGYEKVLADELAAILEQGCATIAGDHQVEPRLAHGDPAQVLAAEGEELDLLVIGSRGYGPAPRALLGGVSTEVMRTATCPVLVTPRSSGGRDSDPEVAASDRIERVMVGFDGSDRGKDSLRLGRAIAEAEGSELIVASVYEPESLFDGDDRYLPPWGDSREKREAQMKRIFAEVDRELGAGQYERRDLWGSPARQLHQAAEADDVSVIVLGSTHQGRLGRVLPGSVGERLLHGAPCAIAVAPVGFAKGDHYGLGMIGVGFDGSPESKIALEYAASLAQDLECSLRLIAVAPEFSPVLPKPEMMAQPDYHQLLREDLERALSAAIEKQDGPDVNSVLLEGDPAAALAAQGVELDLLVVGSRGYGPVRRTMLGSVSAAVIRTAPCPVLVTPRGAGVGRESTAPGAARVRTTT